MREIKGQQHGASDIKPEMIEDDSQPPTSLDERAVTSPPPFQWEDWYQAVGGRTISIEEVSSLLKEIHQEQYPRFAGEVAVEKYEFASMQEAATHLKEKALEFGADIVGICAIEPSDIYRGKIVTEKYAIAVGQRMRWRAFQVVPSQESAIECMRVYKPCLTNCIPSS